MPENGWVADKSLHKKQKHLRTIENQTQSRGENNQTWSATKINPIVKTN